MEGDAADYGAINVRASEGREIAAEWGALEGTAEVHLAKGVEGVFTEADGDVGSVDF